MKIKLWHNVFTAGAGLILGNVILDGSFEWAMSSMNLIFYEFGIPDFIIEDSGNIFRLTFGAVIHLDK